MRAVGGVVMEEVVAVLMAAEGKVREVAARVAAARAWVVAVKERVARD